MINRLVKIVDKISKDKLLHFFVGFFIYIVASVFLPNWIALLIVILIAAGKELIYDKKFNKGTPELLDFIFSILPGIILVLLS
ncbi:hypothetical protein HX071_08555 [Myroides marinus]|uniref:hypothetical protein n=1 Tax=Myroides marinus TaxID=703342 RepID=UPI0025780D12|nr:hypothetical protein [Myroides marinus]MDM1502254.1 hypothetical protein [Myroides marinus]